MSFSLPLSQSQYKFIHDAIREAIICGDTAIKATELDEWLSKLESDPETGSHIMDAQFAVSTFCKCIDFECLIQQSLPPCSPFTIPSLCSYWSQSVHVMMSLTALLVKPTRTRIGLRSTCQVSLETGCVTS